MAKNEEGGGGGCLSSSSLLCADHREEERVNVGSQINTERVATAGEGGG